MFYTEYPEVSGLQRYYDGLREIVALFAKYRPTGGKRKWKDASGVSHDALDISLTKISKSFSLHVVFDNKVKARMSYIRCDIKLRKKKITKRNFFFRIFIYEGTLLHIKN